MRNNFEHISLNATYEIDNDFDSERFIKLRLRICHDGKNPNQSFFTCSGFEKARPSLVKTPVLGHIVYDDDGEPDFGAHDIELEKDGETGDYRIRYLEQPLGAIFDDCDYEVKAYDGRNYVYATAYLWKNYINDGEIILERDQDINLSMEIQVNKGHYDKPTSTYHVDDFKYLGVTLLGRDVSPGMLKAAATTNFSRDEWFTMLDALKTEIEHYSIEKEGKNNLNKEKINEILATYNLKLEDLSFKVTEDMTEESFKAKLDEVVATGRPVIGQPAVQPHESYAATWNQKRDAVQNALDPIVVRDEEGQLVSETWYWVCDMDDQYAYVNRHIWSDKNCEDDNGRFSYSFDEVAMTATITSEFERMIVRWLTEAENAKLDASRNELDRLQTEFDSYKADHVTPEPEVEALRQFQADRLDGDHKLAVDAVLSEFQELAENQEFVAVLGSAYEYQDLDALREKCFAILGKVNYAQFAGKPLKNGLVSVPVVHVSVADDPYPGADVYLEKPVV